MRIGQWRAVAVEIRQHMQPRRETFALGGAQFGDTPGDPGVHGGIGLAAGAVPADDMVEQRAGGRLAAFRQPDFGSAAP
ncbi:hypothetical protein AJ88_32275 [Mesorhizobium amorphae CCBAU 01583]|nr:hypothetical protein AJ88_32275 [Mesorhizobium amorphae CCBAU 01583]